MKWLFRIMVALLVTLLVYGTTPNAANSATKCENIQRYSEEYIAAWTTFIGSVQLHPELYTQDPATLSPDEYAIMQDDLQTLIGDLALLTPPSALRGLWASEIAYWASYVGLLSVAVDTTPGYAGASYGITMTALNEHLGYHTRVALASCPVWQETIDTLDALTGD